MTKALRADEAITAAAVLLGNVGLLDLNGDNPHSSLLSLEWYPLHPVVIPMPLLHMFILVIFQKSIEQHTYLESKRVMK